MRSNRQPDHDRTRQTRRAPGALDRATALGWSKPVLILLALQAGLFAAPAAQSPAPARAAAPAAAPAVLASAGTQKSFFTSDPSFGKDPFFPDSKRRLKDMPVLPLPTTNQVSGVVSGEVSFENLKLKGISRSDDRKLALINYYTFAEGEEQDVKVGNQIITVKCELIKERSVIVRVKDRTKELTLRDGVY